MGIFSMGAGKDRYGVLLDIGSGSVLGAIVHSSPNQSHPVIIWSHREYAPLRAIDSMTQSAKAVMAALVNVSMKLDSEGRKALAEYNPSARLTEMQCGIAAPWSYTVSKQINYSQEESFKITSNLIDDLTLTAQQKIEEELKENESVSNLGLAIVAKSITSLSANGYQVITPAGEETKTLALTQTTVVAQQYLIDVIEEMRQKLFPGAHSKKLSFILMLYCESKDLLPQQTELTLVDVTHEATEIGIIRDGVLQYCTHASFGIFSIAREISEVTQVPLHEAFGYLRSPDPYAFMQQLTKAQQDEIDQIFDLYIERVSQLFHETGDALAIPKTISLHVGIESEPLFKNLIDKAAHRATKLQHKIAPVSTTIFEKTYAADTDMKEFVGRDTALLLSAQFFHKQKKRVSFNFL